MADIFSASVRATTQTKKVPKVVDNVLLDNPGFERFVKNAKPGKNKFNGRFLELPIQTSKYTGFQFFRGAETFDRTVQSVEQIMQYDPTFSTQPITITKTELTVNQMAGENKILDLIDLKLEGAQNALADNLGDAFYGDGSSFGGKSFFGLEALVDDGTNTSTIGNLSRTTYPVLKSTVTASGGTLTLQKMHTLFNNVKSGNIKPTCILTTEAIYSFYELLLTPAVRYSDPSNLSSGTKTLKFQGIDVIADEKCPTGIMYMLNERFIEFWSLPMYDAKPVPYMNNIEGNNYDKETIGLGFSWGDFATSFNQGVVAADIYFNGCFTNSNPRFSGKLTGITGI